MSPDAGRPDVLITDDQTPISPVRSKADAAFGAAPVPGAPGDYAEMPDHGPVAGPDHIAHLTLRVIDLMAFAPRSSAPPKELSGNWTMSFAVPVQSATVLPHEDGFQLGGWKVTIEVFEMTPTVVQLQAVIDGVGLANHGPLFGSPISLLDPSRTSVTPNLSMAESTEADEKRSPLTSPPTSWRFHMHWERPHTAGTYELRFSGNGEIHSIAFKLPAA